MLTEEHKKTFAENIKLVTWLSQKFRCPTGMEHDDWWQEVAVCVMQAIVWHRTERGSLSTLATKLTWNRHSCVCGKLQKDSRLNTVSLDYQNSDGGTLADIITDNSHKPNLDDQETVQQILESMNEKNQEICRGVAAGKSWREIGEDVGLTGEACRQNFGRIRKILNPESVPGEQVKTCQVCARVIVATSAMASVRYCKPCRIANARMVGREQKRRAALRKKGQVA